jgi:hypothetical protein
MTNKQAALSLKISKRQVQRLKKKVAQGGPTGILHGIRDVSRCMPLQICSKIKLSNGLRPDTSISISPIYRTVPVQDWASISLFLIS